MRESRINCRIRSCLGVRFMSPILSSRYIAHRGARSGLDARRPVQSPERPLGLSQQIALCPDQPLRDLQEPDRFRVRVLLLFMWQRARVHTRQPAAEPATENTGESLPAWGLVIVRDI